MRFDGDTFDVFGSWSEESWVGAILPLENCPNATRTGTLDALDLAVDTIVTNSFTPADPVEALARIQRVGRQMAAPDDAAVSLRAQLPRRRTTKPRAASRSDFITERRLAMTVRDFTVADVPGQTGRTVLVRGASGGDGATVVGARDVEQVVTHAPA